MLQPSSDTATQAPGWRRERVGTSLSEVFGSVTVRSTGPLWKRLLAFLGPGYLIAVGYMDPGNWATSLAAGSKFGYALLSIALLSNIMAIVLQALCARLGIGAGRDLAQACRDAFPRAVSIPLWAAAEIAICATDLAEVIGTAIGLNLLFGIPLEIGVLLTALDVFVVLWMQRLGFRWVEAFIVTLLGVIAVCFAIQIAMANPDWGGVMRGFAPTTDIISNPDKLYLALGILGATVMPHNLYLHSGVVQTRRFGSSLGERREAIKLATVDSTLALMLALVINASILILAAATFNNSGKTDVAELDQAYAFLAPLLGSAIAPTSFAVALLCCGLEFDRDRDAVRTDRDGRLSGHPAAGVGAPPDHAVGRHRAGGHRHDLVWRERNRAASDPQSGDPEPATAVRNRAAGDVHGRSPQNGRTWSRRAG